MMRAGYKDRVRVYIAFYNYLGVATDRPMIAEFRNFNWAKEFIPTAQEWLTETERKVRRHGTSVGSRSKVEVEVYDDDKEVFRMLTDDELKAKMEEVEDEH